MAFACVFSWTSGDLSKIFKDFQRCSKDFLFFSVSKDLRQDLPEHADAYTFEVEEGDVLLMGTDGIFDNLHDSEALK